MCYNPGDDLRSLAMKYPCIAVLATAATLWLTIPARAQSQQVDVVGAGISIFNSVINPPHRADEIRANAEVEKAKINARMELDREKLRIEATQSKDSSSAVITQWGATRVPCAPGAVFVNGISQDTVCISPTASISPGYYNYSADKNLLVKVTGGGSQPTPQPSVTDSENVATKKTNRNPTPQNSGF
jgi:hypothetical protein